MLIMVIISQCILPYMGYLNESLPGQLGPVSDLLYKLLWSAQAPESCNLMGEGPWLWLSYADKSRVQTRLVLGIASLQTAPAQVSSPPASLEWPTLPSGAKSPCHARGTLWSPPTLQVPSPSLFFWAREDRDVGQAQLLLSPHFHFSSPSLWWFRGNTNRLQDSGRSTLRSSASRGTLHYLPLERLRRWEWVQETCFQWLSFLSAGISRKTDAPLLCLPLSHLYRSKLL